VSRKRFFHSSIKDPSSSNELIVHRFQLSDLSTVSIDKSNDLGSHRKRSLIEFLYRSREEVKVGS